MLVVMLMVAAILVMMLPARTIFGAGVLLAFVAVGSAAWSAPDPEYRAYARIVFVGMRHRRLGRDHPRHP